MLSPHASGLLTVGPLIDSVTARGGVTATDSVAPETIPNTTTTDDRPARATTRFVRTVAAFRLGRGEGATGQGGQLAVEPLRPLQVRRVPDVVVPRRLGDRAGGQDVLGHRGQYD